MRILSIAVLGVVIIAAGMAAVVADRLPTVAGAAAMCFGFALLWHWPDLIVPALLVVLPLPKILTGVISIEVTGSAAEQVAYQPGLTPGDFLIGLAAAVCLLRIFADGSLRARWQLLWKSPLAKPLVLFWLIAGASLYGLDSRIAGTCFLYLLKLGECFLCYFLVFLLVPGPAAWARCFKVALGAAVFIACVSLVMFASGVSSMETGGRRGLLPLFFSEGRSDFGNYLVLFTAASLSLFMLRLRSGQKAYRLLAAPLPMVVCFLFLYERHLLLGLAAAMFCLLGFTRGTARILLLGIVGFIVLGGLLIVPETVARAEETFDRSGDTREFHLDAISSGAPQGLVDFIENAPLDSSSRHRMLRWVSAAAVFSDHPVLGVGFWADVWTGIGQAHSEYLKILGETGLLGFASFLWLSFRLYKTVKPVADTARNCRVRALAWGLVATLAALLVEGFFSSTIYLIRFGPLLWVVIGLVAVSRHCFVEPALMQVVPHTQHGLRWARGSSALTVWGDTGSAYKRCSGGETLPR